MRRRRPLFAASGALAAVGLTVAGVATGAFSTKHVDHSGAASRVVLEGTGKPTAERTSEWVSPSTGAYRYARDGFVFIGDGKNYEVFNPTFKSASVRMGSSSFLGGLASDARSVGPLRQYLRGDRSLMAADTRVSTGAVGGNVQLRVHTNAGSYKITILHRISRREAVRRGLFDIPAHPNNIDREIAPGRPSTLPVRAYWFGTHIAGRTAVRGIDIQRHRTPAEIALGFPEHAEQTVHFTIYELNGRDQSRDAN